ncbi:MAG: MauE/DoxX family redox-associated membrane protein [Candidatus Krumholzibacteriia bacterium]
MSVESTTIRSSNPVTVFLTSGIVLFVLRVLLGGLFLFSSLQKVQHPDEFAIAVRAYKLLPVSLSNVFALLVAWSEVLAGGMLILGLMTRKAAGAIFVLLVMFTVAIATTLIRGLAIDCGCFSNEGGSQTGFTLIIRNLFLLAASAILILHDGGLWRLSKVFSSRG